MWSDRDSIEVTALLRDSDKTITEKQKVTVRAYQDNLTLDIDGCGLATMEEGFGEVVYLEKHEGKVRLLVWADINEEEPTHVIDLSDAFETNRREEATPIYFTAEDDEYGPHLETRKYKVSIFYETEDTKPRLLGNMLVLATCDVDAVICMAPILTEKYWDSRLDSSGATSVFCAELIDSEDDETEGDDLCDKCMRSGVQVSRTDDDGNTICVECDDASDE